MSEGAKLVAQAEKCSKTSFFGLVKPSWEEAGDLFDQAGRAFRTERSFKPAADAYRKASHAHLQYRALYHAAKSLENAGDVLRDAKSAAATKEALQLWEQAADLFRRDGKAEPACQALEKAAKQHEAAGEFAAAADFFVRVVDIREGEAQPRHLKKPLLKATQLCIKAGKLSEARDLLRKERKVLTEIGDQQNLVHQNVLSEVVVNLALDDYVAADRVFQDCLAMFPRADETQVGSELLDAFEAGDQAALARCTSQQVFSFLDNEMGLLARKLKISDVAPVKPRPEPERITAPALVPVAAAPPPPPPPVEVAAVAAEPEPTAVAEVPEATPVAEDKPVADGQGGDITDAAAPAAAEDDEDDGLL